MSSPYITGRRLEHKCVAEMRKQGFGAQRTAGSHGPFDVVAWSRDVVYFIQVKKVATVGGLRKARRQAHAAWRDQPQPHFPSIHRELWCWHEHTWIIYDLDARDPLEAKR